MRVLWLSAVVLLIDQISKQVVLRTMYRGQSIPLIGDWLKFTYTENPGMAFGITFGPPGTVAVLALIATLLIILYLFQVRTNYLPYRLSLAAVLGGAIGNILDRVFYGVIYGYGPLFQGRVVDFVHVDAWRGIVPDWMPFWGGDYIMLFPIWNGADMAIVGGVIGILLFQGRFHKELEAAARQKTEAESPSPEAEVSDSPYPVPDVLPGNGTAESEAPSTAEDPPSEQAPGT